MALRDNELAFGWYGLPQYAALCIRQARETMGVRIPVLGTRPSVPIEGMSATLNGDVTWLDEGGESYSWHKLGLPIPKIFIATGWANPTFGPLADEVRAAGGHVVLMSDNCRKKTFRQLLGAVYFRVILRAKFSCAFVPGKEGRAFLRFLGMKDDRIVEGLYGGDRNIFSNNRPLKAREKKIVYIGQYIERKGILPFADVFAQFVEKHPDWILELYGSGPLMGAFSKHPNIRVNPFAQPDKLSGILAGARALVLPSLEEHWGLVVHEAALSGCALLLSNRIGSLPDLGAVDNCLTFAPANRAEILAALESFATWDDVKLERARDVSLNLATGFGPVPFAAGVRRICEKILS